MAIFKLGALLLAFCVLTSWFAARFRATRENRARQTAFSLGLTGADVARRLLEVKNIVGVQVIENNGLLTNHYDPVRREIRLSTDNFHGRDLAAIGYAAHETGHAIQADRGYRPLLWRLSAIRYNAYASICIFIFAAPFFIASARLALLIWGIGWFTIRLSDLSTLPVEWNASARAKDALYDARLLRLGKEFDQLQDMMRAAALEKLHGFARFWEWLFSVVFPWRKPKAPQA